MSGYISARDALIRDLETQESALKGANQAYAEDKRKLHEAERAARRSYENRANISRNVDRLKAALALVEGDDNNPIVAEMNRHDRSACL